MTCVIHVQPVVASDQCYQVQTVQRGTNQFYPLRKECVIRISYLLLENFLQTKTTRELFPKEKTAWELFESTHNKTLYCRTEYGFLAPSHRSEKKCQVQKYLSFQQHNAQKLFAVTKTTRREARYLFEVRQLALLQRRNIIQRPSKALGAGYGYF